jgi:transposase
MFLDGAGWHRAKPLAIPENMRLQALPPYSPQLNPMEHIWEELREKWFANEVFDSLDSSRIRTEVVGKNNGRPPAAAEKSNWP